MSYRATSLPSEPLSSVQSKGVFVRTSSEFYAQLSEDATELGVSHPEVLRMVYDRFRRDAMGAHVLERHRAIADDRDRQPLLDAMDTLARAIANKTTQVQAIGVNLNQLTRFANALRASQRVEVQAVADMVSELDRLNDELNQLRQYIASDDALLAAVRAEIR